MKNKLQTYKLNTVTYGTASATFLAIRCLIQLANENKDLYPIETKTIREDFYVDGLITGSNNINELKSR